MLAFERVGAGEPLVLVHGIGHRRQAWYPVLDQLAEHREVILVDLPGHGESDPLVTEGRPIQDVLGEQFRHFLADQQLCRPHVAGNSLGGRIALEAGAAGDARSVTALAPAGFWRSDRGFAYTHRLFATMVGLSRRLQPEAPLMARGKLGRAVMFGLVTTHPGNIDSERALGDFRAFTAALPALREIISQATPFAAEIPDSVPVTIAWGTRDLVLPIYQARVARGALPVATHLRLPGCGHVPMSDDPELVARVLLDGSAPVPGFVPVDGVISAPPGT
jgi:pimeloyl-ACP methyl ester carboxylesterase